MTIRLSINDVPQQCQTLVQSVQKDRGCGVFLQKSLYLNAFFGWLCLASSGIGSGTRACSPARGVPSSTGSARRAGVQEGEAFFHADGAPLCQRPAVVEEFHLIDQLSKQRSIFWMCWHLGVAILAALVWRQRLEGPGKRAAENSVITAEIGAVFRCIVGFTDSCGSTRSCALRVALSALTGLSCSCAVPISRPRPVSPCGPALAEYGPGTGNAGRLSTGIAW
jgi:hypothetical protein